MSQNYLMLSVASSIIATLGLLENSVAVIIGAMIIAPLMSPIQAFAFAVLDGDAPMIRRSLLTALVGTIIAIGTSVLLGLVAATPVYGSEVVARTRPNLLDLGIAVAAGAVAGIARVRPAISSTIAGTAIAVALMPPLCVVGLTLAHLAWSQAEGALLLFGTNFLGIAAACMVVYIIAKEFRSHNRTALVTTIVQYRDVSTGETYRRELWLVSETVERSLNRQRPGSSDPGPSSRFGTICSTPNWTARFNHHVCKSVRNGYGWTRPALGSGTRESMSSPGAFGT